MKKEVAIVDKILPAELLEILGPPPILSTEEERVYYGMMARLAKDIAPNDILTWLLIKDLVDHRIEIDRCRRLKVSAVREAFEERIIQSKAQRKHALDVEIKALREAADAARAKELNPKPYDGAKVDARLAEIEAQFEREASTKRQEYEKAVNTLEGLKPNEKDVMQTFNRWIVGHDNIDDIQERVEKKFFVTLREIERHVLGFAKALREELKIIEAEVLEGGETELLGAESS